MKQDFLHHSCKQCTKTFLSTDSSCRYLLAALLQFMCLVGPQFTRKKTRKKRLAFSVHFLFQSCSRKPFGIKQQGHLTALLLKHSKIGAMKVIRGGFQPIRGFAASWHKNKWLKVASVLFDKVALGDFLINFPIKQLSSKCLRLHIQQQHMFQKIHSASSRDWI